MNKIILENFNEGNGYYKVNLAYLNKEQVEEIESLVSKWNLTDEDFIHCIGMCLTDASEQRFKDYGTNLRDCLAWLEKQGEKESDPRYKYLEELLAADAIYQMSMNDEMAQEAKEKAINALSEMCIGRLLGLENQDDYDDNIITRDDEILQAISIGLTDIVEDFGWSDFGGLPIEEIQSWLEKQGESERQKGETLSDWWVARDADGDLYIYNAKPQKSVLGGYYNNKDDCEIPKELFPDLKREDEPMKVEITIKPKTT